jgi:Rad3-related DNA helicase
MKTISVRDRDLILAVRLEDESGPMLLGIDLITGQKILELSEYDPDRELALGAILVLQDEVALPRKGPGGGLILPGTVFWSILDPLGARFPVDEPREKRLAAEGELHDIRTRFLERLRWWRELDPAFCETCTRSLRGFRPDFGPLWEMLDEGIFTWQREATDQEVEEEPAIPAYSCDLPGKPSQYRAWFTDADGLGAMYGDTFMPRDEQAEMAVEVARSLYQGEPLLMEAGTGVGKTLAYLAPLIGTILKNGKRGVVSTHTRALQNQIMEKDLPRLQSLLGEHSFALLMGRRNYLCLRQRQAFLARSLNTISDGIQAMAFRLWLFVTENGFREEVARHPVLAAEIGDLFDTSDLCLPGLCYDGDKCFVQRARRAARTADLLVVNHSLLMHDFKADHILLGEIDHLVVDEAHRLPGVALDSHGVVCHGRRLDDIAETMGDMVGPEALPTRVVLLSARLKNYGREGESASAACDDFGRSVRRVFVSFPKWWQALAHRVDGIIGSGKRPRGKQRITNKDEMFGPMMASTEELLDVLAECESSFAKLARRTGVLEDLSGGMEDELAILVQGGQLLRQLHLDVRFLTTDPDEEWVTWLEPHHQSGIRLLGATLLEAGSLLRNYWYGSDLKPVMTSATLAVGEDFSHMLGELGLARRSPGTNVSCSSSPFDYHRQSKILVPKQFPAPTDPSFGRAIGQVMELLSGMPHKVLGLYTSYKLINDTAGVLERSYAMDPDMEKRIITQTPRTAPGALIEKFRRLDRAMLLGTSTFWEGVDFPGQDLEILVVTKLPFLVPNDPWVQARCDRISAAGDNPFTSFMVRDAVLRLRQGFGRLIRRASDRGVVIILDNRLHTKNYGVTFLGALPVVPDFFTDNEQLETKVTDFFQHPTSDG